MCVTKTGKVHEYVEVPTSTRDGPSNLGEQLCLRVPVEYDLNDVRVLGHDRADGPCRYRRVDELSKRHVRCFFDMGPIHVKDGLSYIINARCWFLYGYCHIRLRSE